MRYASSKASIVRSLERLNFENFVKLLVLSNILGTCCLIIFHGFYFDAVASTCN